MLSCLGTATYIIIYTVYIVHVHCTCYNTCSVQLNLCLFYCALYASTAHSSSPPIYTPSPLLAPLSSPLLPTVVCYCSVGYRSSDIAKKLYHSAKQAGFSLDVHNMEGGVFQWAIEGREIVDNNGEKASVVHPYNTVFGKLLPWKLRASL